MTRQLPSSSGTRTRHGRCAWRYLLAIVAPAWLALVSCSDNRARDARADALTFSPDWVAHVGVDRGALGTGSIYSADAVVRVREAVPVRAVDVGSQRVLDIELDVAEVRYAARMDNALPASPRAIPGLPDGSFHVTEVVGLDGVVQPSAFRLERHDLLVFLHHSPDTTAVGWPSPWWIWGVAREGPDGRLTLVGEAAQRFAGELTQVGAALRRVSNTERDLDWLLPLLRERHDSGGPFATAALDIGRGRTTTP